MTTNNIKHLLFMKYSLKDNKTPSKAIAKLKNSELDSKITPDRKLSKTKRNRIFSKIRPTTDIGKKQKTSATSVPQFTKSMVTSQVGR